jgi:hypothetical protein
VDSLENVRFPSVGDSIEVDEVTMSVMLRKSSNLNNNISDSITSRGKRDYTISELRPFFEFPFHLNPLVFLKRDVLSSDGASKEHELAAFFFLRDSLALRHLTESHLVSHGVVNNVFWDIPGDSNFSSLRHD